MKKVVIHSDGACQGNPGPGGWAAVLSYGNRSKQISGGAAATTNNRMEMQAAIAALNALREPCEVAFHTDSQYLRKGMEAWIHGWRKNGWKTKSRTPVKNADLWQALDTLANRHKITWHWVKGHAGNEENERCDHLATLEAEKIRRRLAPAQLKEALKEFRRATPLQEDFLKAGQTA
jgi:ribonuclease HI